MRKKEGKERNRGKEYKGDERNTHVNDASKSGKYEKINQNKTRTIRKVSRTGDKANPPLDSPSQLLGGQSTSSTPHDTRHRASPWAPRC